MINIEAQIKTRLATRCGGASIALLAYLSSCSKTLLSEAANGTANLAREVALRVDAVLKELEAFVASMAPIKPDLRDARAVESWLDEFRAKRARAAAANSAPDPLTLLAELSASDADTVARNHGWERSELIAQLAAARDRLHEATLSLSASNEQFSSL